MLWWMPQESPPPALESHSKRQQLALAREEGARDALARFVPNVFSAIEKSQSILASTQELISSLIADPAEFGKDQADQIKALVPLLNACQMENHRVLQRVVPQTQKVDVKSESKQTTVSHRVVVNTSLKELLEARRVARLDPPIEDAEVLDDE